MPISSLLPVWVAASVNERILIPFAFARSFLQTDTVQALRGDPDSSEAEHARIMLVQTEAERVKFVVRSYIRTRLYKVRCLPLSRALFWLKMGDSQIEKLARYIVSTPEVQEKLSQAELDHAKRYVRPVYFSPTQ
jgi:GINS complex subunit 4